MFVQNSYIQTTFNKFSGSRAKNNTTVATAGSNKYKYSANQCACVDVTLAVE